VIQPVNYGVQLDPGLNGPLICLGHGHVREVNAGGLPAPLCQINRISPLSHAKIDGQAGFPIANGFNEQPACLTFERSLGILEFRVPEIAVTRIDILRVVEAKTASRPGAESSAILRMHSMACST
jgi:hypothetical protein